MVRVNKDVLLRKVWWVVLLLTVLRLLIVDVSWTVVFIYPLIKPTLLDYRYRIARDRANALSASFSGRTLKVPPLSRSDTWHVYFFISLVGRI